MALALGNDPCSMLNMNVQVGTTPMFAPSSSANATMLSKFVKKGVIISLKTFLTPFDPSSLNVPILASIPKDTNPRLLNFLSGKGLAREAYEVLGVDFRMMSNCLLRPLDIKAGGAGGGSGSTIVQGFANMGGDPRAGINCRGGGTGAGSSLPMCQGPSGPVPIASQNVMTIVDDYILPQVGGNYTWSESGTSSLSANSIWNPSDQKTDQTFGIVMNPTSIVGKLIKDGFLLSGEELYAPSTGIGNAPPQEGSESLFYFYKMAQSQNALTMTQKQRKVTIECKNMRFFAAYILEYCYYKSRYDFFLSLYFSVFTESNYSPVSQSTLDSLFTGPGTGTSEYSGTDGFVGQDDYLKGIAYQMACLNTRMNDLRSILNYVNNYYTGILNAYQERLNSMGEQGSTNEVENKILALQQSADDAQEYLSQADFRKGVMEYNSEKNRYANVLLGLYAFLNISALAVIFHVMRS
jgi:hypothetical protein